MNIINFVYKVSSIEKCLLIFLAGLPCITAGWGFWKVVVGPTKKKFLVRPDNLQFLTDKMMDKDTCKKSYTPSAKMVKDSVLCTVPQTNKSICMVNYNCKILCLTFEFNRKRHKVI